MGENEIMRLNRRIVFFFPFSFKASLLLAQDLMFSLTLQYNHVACPIVTSVDCIIISPITSLIQVLTAWQKLDHSLTLLLHFIQMMKLCLSLRWRQLVIELFSDPSESWTLSWQSFYKPPNSDPHRLIPLTYELCAEPLSYFISYVIVEHKININIVMNAQISWNP